MNIGILILMIVGGVSEFYHHYILRSASGHDYLENLSQNPSWI